MTKPLSNPLLFLPIFLLVVMTYSADALTMTEHNTAYVAFDVSMPIDSTGYTLHGQNLQGGNIQFNNTDRRINPLLALETGSFQLPIVKSPTGNPLIKTSINYQAIKFINPNGIDNLFIKVGIAHRTQTVHGLDPSVLKNGTYQWQAPFFAFGKESNTVDNKRSNLQFIQIGSLHGGPASKNVMYTQDFRLYSKGVGNTPTSGQTNQSFNFKKVLLHPYKSHYTCHVDGLWGAGGADPYRTITGKCQGYSMTFPAGPNLDYEYGHFNLPTVHTPWSATPKDQCIFPGNKKHNGCVNASIAIQFNYSAQKIRVPISQHVMIFAESGTAYRHITPTNLRYVCKSNVYLKKILPKKDCLKKSYLPGGASYPYFAFGFSYVTQQGKRYTARYINIPGQENGNRLAWLDASNTYICATNVAGNQTQDHYLKMALDTIKSKRPLVYKLLKHAQFCPQWFAKVSSHSQS